MRALLESARRHLASVRDELVHQQADARARNKGKPSRVLTEQMHHIDGAIGDIEEALDEEGCREKARDSREPIDVDLDEWAKQRAAKRDGVGLYPGADVE